MGQLIKLQDYVSRYEQNIFHYPSRFVLLKKQQWEKLKYSWENPEEIDLYNRASAGQHFDWMEEEKSPLFDKIKTVFKRKNRTELDEQENQTTNESNTDGLLELDHMPVFFHRPNTIEELKQQYLNQLFDFQMKWATSTIAKKSYINKKFYYDEHLKFFLQRFPDTYLLLYKPIFLLKKAPIEVECILISPTEVWCINFLEENNLSVFIGSNERFWSVRSNNEEKKILNPLLALNRTEKIVKTIFRFYDIGLPIRKVLLSRNGYIDYPTAPFDVHLIEKRKYEEWFQTLRSLRTPLKHTQLMGAKALLQHCQTTSRRRLEWEVPDENKDDMDINQPD